jgi:mitochondrial fission protein ELM1
VETGAYLLATSSRRTPPWADEILKAALKGQKQCPLLVIANESNLKGAVPGILGLSDVLVVSGESISMVSEAIVSGKPVVVFLPFEKAILKPKHEEFLERMFQQKLIVRAKPETLYEIIQKQMMQENGRVNPVGAQDREVLRQAVRRVI